MDHKLTDIDTKSRIIEASIHLFGVKGFDGTSIRDITKMANCNVAALNYHFKSKHNLLQEVTNFIITEFKAKIKNIANEEVATAEDYAIRVFQTLTEDEHKCLNQFKLFLDAENFPCEMEPYPLGFEQLSMFLNKELNPNVPTEEKLWANSVIFTYIIHTAVMSCSHIGKKNIEKFFNNNRETFLVYIRQLVSAVIRDLNSRFPI
ncbi:MAG: TetR family transcriptional regulator [Bacteriovoracaceae bacterium]